MQNSLLSQVLIIKTCEMKIQPQWDQILYEVVIDFSNSNCHIISFKIKLIFFVKCEMKYEMRLYKRFDPIVFRYSSMCFRSTLTPYRKNVPKVRIFHQCSKMQIIPIKKFKIQSCFFQFFRLKC